MIPKILHQSSKYFTWEERRIAKRAQALMPDWTYRHWTDADNLTLIKQVCPRNVEEYEKLPGGASKTDVARYIYMYKYGGIYFDTDFRFFRPICEKLLSQTCILGVEEDDAPYLGGPKLGNAFLGSRPGLTLWLELVETIFARFRAGESYPWALSGPYALTAFLQHNKQYEKIVTILPRHVLYPKLIKFNLTGVRAPETIGVHLCWSSWRGMSAAHKVKNRTRRILSAIV